MPVASVVIKLLGYLSIFILAVISCLSCLNGDFVFDDTEAILNNKDILPSTPIWDVFDDDFWGTTLTHNLSHKSYRPLTVLSFRLNYILGGGFVSRNYHAVNIILHGLISMLTWKVFIKVLGDTRQGTAFQASLVFAVHPIHTEAVCGIVGRADLLSGMFFFLSFLAFTKSNMSSVSGWFWFTISLIGAVISMFCKEQGITVLGFSFVYDLIAVKKLSLWGILRTVDRILDRRKIVLWTVEWLSPIILAVFGVGCLWFRCYLMDFQSPSFQPVDNPASHAEDMSTRILSYSYVFSLNVWILLCPIWLCFDWSMGCVPLVTIGDARFFLVLIFWLCLGYFVWRGVITRDLRRQRDILLGLSLTIISFLPASNMLFSVGFVIAERVLYIPSAGFCLLVACGLELLCNRYPLNKNDASFSFILLLLVLTLRSHHRSREWKTEQALFNAGLQVCPDNAKVHYNVAKNAADVGDTDRAVAEYKEAVRLYPEYEQALNNLANILKHKGDLSEAEVLLRRAIRVRNNFPAAWMNLGIVLANSQQFAEAEKCYFNAIKFRKNYPDCFYNLGNMYQEQKRFSDAEKAWKTATRLNPMMPMAWNNLIILYDNLGEYRKAVEIGEDALALIANEPSLHFNMANALGKLGLFEESESHFVKVLALNPANALYHVNLGVLYHRWNKLDKAESCYKNALKLNPQLKSAIDNYAMLRKQIGKKPD